MSFHDCLKCWDTPCTCGYDYRWRSKESLANFLADICQYRSKQEAIEALEKAIDIVIHKAYWQEKE